MKWYRIKRAVTANGSIIYIPQRSVLFFWWKSYRDYRFETCFDCVIKASDFLREKYKQDLKLRIKRTYIGSFVVEEKIGGSWVEISQWISGLHKTGEELVKIRNMRGENLYIGENKIIPQI